MSGHILNKIPLKLIKRNVYVNSDERVTLLQACYDNPLFQEEETRYPGDDLVHRGNGSVNGDKRLSSRSKDYVTSPDGLPMSDVRFSYQTKKKSCVVKVILVLLVILVLAILIGLLVHFTGK